MSAVNNVNGNNVVNGLTYDQADTDQDGIISEAEFNALAAAEENNAGAGAGGVSSSLFDELNTEHDTITDMDIMGYTALGCDPSNPPSDDPSWTTPQQYLNLDEISAGIKSGKISWAMQRWLDNNADRQITQAEFEEMSAIASEIGFQDYFPDGTPGQVVDSSTALGSVLCRDGTISGALWPMSSFPGSQLNDVGNVHPDNAFVTNTTQWGWGTSTLDTPDVTIIDDMSHFGELDAECNQVQPTCTIIIKDPTNVRIGWNRCGCASNSWFIDTNNDGVGDINIDQYYSDSPELINIVINGQTYNLGEYLNSNPNCGVDPNNRDQFTCGC